ncbi:unnamed protein product [Fraxinus pennsylvanica]|uniref:Uncharacterized protein n=1 Tax=Fraxinus pennsylvanica TaxID=56036 RepID=A0AAD2EBG7_9LAMI|nr:unnamed protein product [Fraxinus pennsylvanica]
MRGEIPEVSNKDIFSKIEDLSHNNLSGPIPLFAFQSDQLHISKSMLSGSISLVCKIPNDFFTSILDLSDNQLSGKLPDCWKSLTNLIVLNLANNYFRGKIPNSIGALYRLQALHLRNNNIMGKLPSALKNCTNLRMIDFGENKLTGDIPAWIGTHITRLAVLSLRSNKFHGNLSPTICQLVNIQILDLSINHISGKIPRCLNNFTFLVEKNSSIETNPIGELGLLKGIDLSGNMFVGTIPQELSDMRGLIFLNLSRSHLTGNIISSIGQMEMLEWLDLSRNQLSGEIPTGLANLNFLSILDLSYNNLTGKIPLGTQLQSFNPSAYGGNNKLCGRPLAECPQDAPDPSLADHGKENNVEEDDRFITREFYFCIAFGFIFGFWAVIGTLFLKHSWRHAYFNFFNNVGKWMYVTTAMVDAWGGWSQFQVLLQTLKKVASKHGISIPTFAVKYILDQPAVAGSMVGVRRGLSEHIKATNAVFSLVLDEEDVSSIQELSKRGYIEIMQFQLEGEASWSWDTYKKKGKWKQDSWLRTHKFFCVFLLMLFSFGLVSGKRWDGVVVTKADYPALRTVKQEFVDLRGVLRSWNDSGIRACLGGWIGIKCVNGQFIAIQLPWNDYSQSCKFH